MRNCDQFLYIREEVNHHIGLLNSILTSVYTNLRTYRSALFAFRMNILSSTTAIADGMLPLSLIPRKIFIRILQRVLLETQYTRDRLTLSIPIEHVMSYYETRLVTSLFSVDFGLMLTLSIPFSSGSTALDVFHAIPVPMPTKESTRATIWVLETPYIAVTETQSEAALLTEFDLQECIGSKLYSICFSSFAMEKSKDSCLATLLFKDTLSALEVCSIRSIQLPIKEKAQSLGHGRWLITSATPNFLLSTRSPNSSHSLSKEHRQGCQVCIIILACGQELEGPNIHLRSDWSTCQYTTPVRLDINLPTPLSFLFNQLPSLDSMPQMSDIDIARVQLVEEVHLQLIHIPEHKRRNYKELEKVTEPIVNRMKQFHPQITAKFDETVHWTPYIVFAITTFILSFGLHFLMSYLFHRYIQVHRRFPFRLTISAHTIKSQPILVVSDEDYDYLRQHPNHRIREKGLIFRRRDLNLPNPFFSPSTTTVDTADSQSASCPESEQSNVPPPHLSPNDL